MSTRQVHAWASGVHRPDLQGLRAVAVALVVLEHAGLPGVPGGFIGVDVFFVLSGFLITGLLLREHAATGRLDIARFLVRRAHRLLPAMAVMLLVTAWVAALVLAPVELDRRARSLPYAAVWASNLYFAFADVDYFGEPGGGDLFLHTWSLGVEEQFYLLWPALLLLVLGLRGRLPARARDAALPAGLGTVAVLSFGLAWYWMAAQPLWSFYLMPARVWQLALGALLCVLARPLEPHVGRLLVASGLLVLLGCGVWLHRALAYPGYFALLPALGAALIIVGGQGSPQRRVLAHGALTWLGDRSYSLYLWHWPVLMLGGALGLARSGSGVGLLAGLSVLLAMASYRVIERPFWKGRLAPRASRQSALGAALVMALAVSGGFQYLAHTRGAMQQIAPGVPDLAAVRADVPPIYAAGCDSWYQSAALTPCVVGAADAPHTVVLLGDSILAQWFSLLPALFPAPQWRIVVFTKSACPMVDEDYFYVRINRTYTVCTQ